MKRILFIAAAAVVLTACTTSREVATSERSVEDFMQRIDSLVRAQRVTQTDSAWHELVLRQLESISEKTDTSHTLVIDTAGKVIKETLIIRTEKDRTSESESHEREVIMRRLEVMDSTITIMQQQIAHSDSLLQTQKQVVEVPVQLTWWQKTKMKAGVAFLCLIGLTCLIGLIWLIKKFWK